MTTARNSRNLWAIPFLITVFCIVNVAPANEPPVADAGLPRYAATEPVQLDGSTSYDPDESGSLTYMWAQVSGPPVVIRDANTPTPKISGPGRAEGREVVYTFAQTDEIQICEFELMVSDGELTSVPDTVAVIIVPDFGASTLQQANPPFDRDKPTLIYFGGGNCVTGSGSWASTAWAEKANIINFPTYGPDPSIGGLRTYYRYGDIIIAYLSSAAPDYRQPIQTSGYSTGGQPAIDVGIRLNLTYADARYAVNRVTFLDATGYCRDRDDYSESITAFLGSSVDGEQCWIDSYPGTLPGTYGMKMDYGFQSNVLNVWFDSATGPGGVDYKHALPGNFYRNSLIDTDLQQFNHGIIAGAYWSVIGPGKNLQLAFTPGVETYKFTWYGDASSGYMDLYDEAQYPGRLPEPVTLLAWRHESEPDGAVLSCKPSENVVAYELIMGTDPYSIRDYAVISDTPDPPIEYLSSLPSEEMWWTVRARDESGSTIYADLIRLSASDLPGPRVENLTIAEKYGSIELALHFAKPGDEIVIGPGRYAESIDLGHGELVVRSSDPHDPDTVAATVIAGGGTGPAVTFSSGIDSNCVLAGLTIVNGTVGISCRDASPTITNCTVEAAGGTAVEFWYGYPPSIVDCTILGDVVQRVDDPSLIAFWDLDETAGEIARDHAQGNDAVLHGNPVWQPGSGKVGGALAMDGVDDFALAGFVLDPADGPFSVFVWVQGGAPGQVVLSQVAGADWLIADPTAGSLMTDLNEPGRFTQALRSQTAITDGDWHHIGLVWDGASRTLYVDDVPVAQDTRPELGASNGGLNIGCGSDMAPGTFFSGLIDDVRIHNRAVEP